MGGNVDLHVHSGWSDGTLRANDTVDLAYSKDIRYFALTDHDTSEGVLEAVERAKEIGMWIVPGIEISTDYVSVHSEPPGKVFELHLLGYGINPEHPGLVSRLKYYADKRRERLLRIFNNLNYCFEEKHLPVLDIKDYIAMIRKAYGTVGRPLLARWLKEKGYVSTEQEAFDRWLIRYDEKKEPFAIEDAAKLIYEAGGIPILAHPHSYKISLAQIVAGHPAEHQARMVSGILEDMAERKIIGGVEAIYFDHDQGMREFFVREANRLNLLVTAGSDHHGGEMDRLGTLDASLEDVSKFVERFS